MIAVPPRSVIVALGMLVAECLDRHIDIKGYSWIDR